MHTGEPALSSVTYCAGVRLLGFEAPRGRSVSCGELHGEGALTSSLVGVLVSACQKPAQPVTSSYRGRPKFIAASVCGHRRHGVQQPLDNGCGKRSPEAPLTSDCIGERVLDAHSSRRSDRFECSARHRFARRKRIPSESSRLDLQPGDFPLALAPSKRATPLASSLSNL